VTKPRDLDAAVAGKIGEPRAYILSGREFTLPARLPLAVAAAVATQDFDRLALILAAGDADLAAHLSTHLNDAHLEAIAQDYGIVPGESEASAG
jgi:hypothetical protein